MTMPWFRMHSADLLTPPLATMPHADFHAFVNLLGIANSQAVRGVLPPLEELVFLLRMKDGQVVSLLHRCMDYGLVAQDAASKRYVIANLERYYRKGDNYVERQRTHRDTSRDIPRESSEQVTHVATESVLSGLSVSSLPDDRDRSSLDPEDKTDRQTETVTRHVTSAVGSAYLHAFPDWELTEESGEELGRYVAQFGEERVLWAIREVSGRPVRKNPLAAIAGACRNSKSEGRKPVARSGSAREQLLGRYRDAGREA